MTECARFKMKMLDISSNRLVEKEENIYEYPIVTAREGSDTMSFTILFEQEFEAYRAEVSINGEPQVNGWSMSIRWPRAAVINTRMLNNGDVIEIGIYSKKFQLKDLHE